MASLSGFWSSMMSTYKNINSSTLTGAIDTIVVEQEDGTLLGTPFHVRFGKLGVLQNQRSKVYITINGRSVDDLNMELGEAGQGVFLVEAMETISSSPNDYREPSNENSFTGSDQALAMTSTDNKLTTNELNQGKTSIQEAPKNENNGEIHWTEFNGQPSSNTRHRTKRSLINNTSHESSDDDDDDQEVNGVTSITKRASRARKREILSGASIQENKHKPTSTHSFREIQSPPIASSRRRSASETEPSVFQLDDDDDAQSATFVDAHSRINSIDSRQKSLLNVNKKISSVENEADSDSSSEDQSLTDQQIPVKTTRTSSNPIPIEPMNKPSPMTPLDESNPMSNPLISQSAPIPMRIDSGISIPIRGANKPADVVGNEYFPLESLPNPTTIRPESPKSDTEYELDKSLQQAAMKKKERPGWRWKWGEFPRLFFSSSSRKNAPAQKKPTELNEGIYLDDIATNKCLDPSLYLIQVDYNQNQQRIIKDDDQESGTGNSIPHSPVREQEMAYLLGDVQISLCGNQQKLEDITDELFYTHLVSYEAFAGNPSIINDPNLVVRIAGKFYTWDVASLVLTASNVYGKQLPSETIEQLQENTNSPSKTRSSRVGSWWPFSSMKNETSEEYSPSAATEALAFVVKSEVVPTLSKQVDLIQRLSHDSEQEDHEVRKLTERTNEKDNKSSTPGVTGKKMLKRTMTLTSEQLKRLNLNFGVNVVQFSVTNAIQGTTVIEANIFLFDYRTKFVISDIDGTITKSDVFGHILPLVGRDWSHDGIAQLFQAIQENGYQFIYLSARAIGQSRVTRNFLRSVNQRDAALPEGPLLISPDTLFAAFYREVILKKPEEFKINCLKNIASLFPSKNPFYAGFGNRTNDQSAYTAVGIPETRIFTINPSGQVVRDKISQVISTSYKNLHEVVDQIFPPADCLPVADSFSSFTFWHKMPEINDSLEQEMRQHLEQMELAKRSKSKGKLASSPTTTTPLTQIKS